MAPLDYTSSGTVELEVILQGNESKDVITTDYHNRDRGCSTHSLAASVGSV